MEKMGITPPIFFKRLSILFEEVVFNHIFCPVGKNDPWKTGSEYLAQLVSKDVTERDLLVSNREYHDIFLDCWEYVGDVEKFENEVQTSVSDKVINEIWRYAHEKTMPEGQIIHTKAFKELCGDLMYDLKLYTQFKKLFPETVGSLSSLYGDVLNRVKIEPERQAIDLITNNINIPDFGQLSWSVLLELRKDDYIKSFRTKIAEFTSSENMDVKNIIDHEVIKGLWELAERVKPNLPATSINGILTNIPLPLPVNPYGLALAAKEVIDAKRICDKYGWIFFIQNVKVASEL